MNDFITEQEIRYVIRVYKKYGSIIDYKMRIYEKDLVILIHFMGIRLVFSHIGPCFCTQLVFGNISTPALEWSRIDDVLVPGDVILGGNGPCKTLVDILRYEALLHNRINYYGSIL